MSAGADSGGGGRVRLLVVTHSLSWGGAERFASTLLGGLDRGRFAPEACIVSERATTYDLSGDVPVHRLGYRRAADLPRTVLRLRRLLARGGYDVVLSNVLKTNALTGAALAGRPHPAWVARVGLAPGRGDSAWARAAARAVYPRAAALVANSERMAAALRERHPRLAARVRHLPNPTDFARIDRLAAETPSGAIAAAPADPEGAAIEGRAREPAPVGGAAGGAGSGPPEQALGERAPLLVAMGRLDRQKRPDLALAALARIRERCDARRCDARLIWCGDGPLRPAVERQASALGVAAAVRFAGFVDNPFPLLRSADLFLLTSDFEGLPNALIEAQGLGIPAVATRCPFGPDEVVVDDVTGRLVPPGDAAAFSDAVLELLADPGRRRAMGEAAARRARERFAAERVVPLWAALLESAAAD
jgi:N-acetylgalactosamine-N,N'-diacetylbacillosaminyl-diphospho-undecaprenol 4-alpha-N-acetylgalactosaminyltransferase